MHYKACVQTMHISNKKAFFHIIRKYNFYIKNLATSVDGIHLYDANVRIRSMNFESFMTVNFVISIPPIFLLKSWMIASSMTKVIFQQYSQPGPVGTLIYIIYSTAQNECLV